MSTLSASNKDVKNEGEEDIDMSGNPVYDQRSIAVDSTPLVVKDEEEEEDIDMSDIPVYGQSSPAVDITSLVSNLAHTEASSHLPPRSSEAHIDENKAKWIEIFRPSFKKGYQQLVSMYPRPSDQTWSSEPPPAPQAHTLYIPKKDYLRDVKYGISLVLDRRHIDQSMPPPEGTTGELKLRLREISTTNSNSLVLTVEMDVYVSSAQGQRYVSHQTVREYTFNSIGRSYKLATDQGIQDFKDRLQTAGIAGNLCEHIISDLCSVLDSSKTEHAVLQRLSSIKPPILSDLHLSVKLRINPSWLTNGELCTYTYDACHLDAQVTFRGAMWDKTRKAWKPITVETEDSHWDPGSGEISLPVALPTSNEALFCLKLPMAKHTDLLLFPMPIPSNNLPS